MGIRTVGVVGLGNMGLGMAATLVRAGFAVTGTDTIAFTGEILRPDGSESHVARRTGSRADATPRRRWPR